MQLSQRRGYMNRNIINQTPRVICRRRDQSRLTTAAGRRPPIRIFLVPRRELQSQSYICLKAVVIGKRDADLAGKRPPKKPIITANIRAVTINSVDS